MWKGRNHEVAITYKAILVMEAPWESQRTPDQEQGFSEHFQPIAGPTRVQSTRAAVN